MDFIRNNSRLIVAGLISAGIIALLVGNGGNNTENQTDKTEDQMSSQTENTADTSVDQPAAQAPAEENTETQIGRTPSAGPVAVKKDDANYSATFRAGDNQTVVVRQIVNDFLTDRSQKLSAEKRLYIETVIVDSLPRNNLVYVGDSVSVSATKLADTVSASDALTAAELARWSRYL